MEFLRSLIDEIRQHHKDKIFEYEFAAYYDKYRRYYEAEIEASPKDGFFNCMAWDAERRREFAQALKQLKIKIEADPVTNLHAYNLEEDGLKRLSELQQKIDNKN